MFNVPDDSAERAWRALRESHPRTWLTMVAYSNGAPSSFRLWRNALSWRTAPSKHRGCQKSIVEAASRYTPRSNPAIAQLTELFSPIGSADPNATIRSKFPVKKQGPPGPIKSLQEGPDRSWDAHLQMDLRGLCSAPNMQWRAL